MVLATLLGPVILWSLITANLIHVAWRLSRRANICLLAVLVVSAEALLFFSYTPRVMVETTRIGIPCDKNEDGEGWDSDIRDGLCYRSGEVLRKFQSGLTNSVDGLAR
jgi:hypothetical protein